MERGKLVFLCLTLVGVLTLGSSMGAWAEERVKITYMFWGDPVGLGLVAAKAAFEAANPDIEVELLEQSAGYKDQLRVYIVGGTAPDVFALDHQDVVEYVRNGWAADLTTYIERSPDFKVEEFLPPVRDIGTVDGMEVGFPNGTATNMYYFNQDLFVESGLETPLELYQRDAWTWEAFREAARRNMRYDSSGNPITWGASVHLGDTLSRGWIWSNGGLEVDDVKNPTVALWDRPEAVEALDFMQRMIHDDEVAIREGSTTNGFLNGTLAMYARWNSAFPLHAQAPFEWGIVPYPKGPSAQGRYAADLTAALAAMSPSTKHPEEAWKWIAFISSYEGNVFRLEASGGIPSRAAFTEREIAMYQPDNLINPEMLFLPLQIGQSRIMAPNQGDIWRAAYAELAKIFNNEVPASIGAASAAAMANAVIAGGAVD